MKQISIILISIIASHFLFACSSEGEQDSAENEQGLNGENTPINSISENNTGSYSDNENDTNGTPSETDSSTTDTQTTENDTFLPPEDCNPQLNHFSFFVMSLEAILDLSGSDDGFGGNIGGIKGADEKCQITAEKVGSCRRWRAFLSATDDGVGNPIHAIERIGDGPWYDVNGYLLGQNIGDLQHTRPRGDDDIVYNDGWVNWTFSNCLTTELGNCNLSYGDTHDTITGSSRDGYLYSDDSRHTCHDWTSDQVNVELPIGHTWPRNNDVGFVDGAHWIFAHTNCVLMGSGGWPGPGGRPGGDGETECNGCGANINVLDTFEEGIGGNGGYGAWYCFAYDEE